MVACTDNIKGFSEAILSVFPKKKKKVCYSSKQELFK